MKHTIHTETRAALLRPAIPVVAVLALGGTLSLGAHACAGAGAGAGEGSLPSAPAAAPAQATPAAGEPVAAVPSPVKHSDVPLLPRPVTSFGAVVHDGWLYVLGGYFGEPHDYHRDGQSGTLQRVRLDDPAANWEDLPGIEPLQSVALVAHGDSLVRVGGMRATNPPGQPAYLVSTTEAARFRLATGRWEPLPALPAGRSSHDAVVLDGTLYVLGGWRLEGNSDEGPWHRDGLALDLDAPKAQWRSFASPVQRRGLAVVAAAGRVVVIGGMDPDANISQQVDIYDPRTGAWKRGPDYPVPAFGVAAAGVGNHIYASAMDGTVYRLAVGEERWQPVTTLTFPRFFHRLQPAGDQLVAVGGILGMQKGGRVRAIERVPVNGEADAPRVTRFTLASPGAAKNRQGLFLRGSTLYAFGGNRSLEQHDFGPDSFLSEGHALQLGPLTWKPMAEFPVRRQTMQTLVGAAGDAGDIGIAVGGFGHDGKVARTFSETFVYDFEENAWQARPGTLPAPRSQFGLVQHQGQLWVFGGLDYDPNRSSSVEGRGDEFRHPLEVLKAPLADASAGFQNAGINLPQPRRAFGGALLGDRYYLVGGMRENFQLVTGCDVYDFATRTWTTIPAPRHTRISPQLVALGGKLYLAGGVSSRDGGESSPDPSIEVFDPRTGRWSVLVEELPIVTNHMRMFAYGDRLLLYSAHSPEDEVHVLIVHPGALNGAGAGAGRLTSR